MIEPTLRDRLITVYASWLDRDDFGPHDTQVFGPQQDHGVNSVRQFLEELIRASSKSNAFVERPPALDDPDGTFLRLLGSTLVSRSGPPRRVEAVAHQVLCLQVIPRLVSKVLSSQDQFDNGMLFPGPNLPEAGSVDADALRRWIDNPVNHAGLAEALMTVLKAKLARRTIRSFFTVDAASNGYRLWAPYRRAPKDAGSALPRHVVHTSAGDVGIDVMRYSDDQELPVRAYEWCAELRNEASSEAPDAVAYGMAYSFDRKMGVPAGGKWELMAAADCLADVDLLQVNAFFEQHPDGQALIDAGDLAFVWLWERRAGVQPGAGQTCLRAALADLRQRLRRIRTVVIELKPYQYVVSDAAAMPSTIHIEKLEALDRLQSFVDGLHLGKMVKGQCRYIVNRDGEDPNAALHALGLAGLEQQASRGQGSG